MSKTKRSHRSETKADDDEDLSSDQSNSTNDNSAGHKKRHHKKSKKVRKHKSKRKDSSDSDSDSSNNSSDNSSDAEIVKRSKKQKKHKKSKRRHRHDAKDSSAADDSDVHAKTTKEAQKTHYLSGGGVGVGGGTIDDDDERQRQRKLKRIDEMKKLRGVEPTYDEKGIKSKWDSPTGDDYDTKRSRAERRSNDGDDFYRGAHANRNESNVRRDRSRRSAEHRRADEVPARRVEPRRDDGNSRYVKRPNSRSRSRSVDLKRARNPDFGRDRDREVRHERAGSLQRDRAGDRARFGDNRPAAGGRGRRSPSPRNDLGPRRDNYHEAGARRPNFGDNRRGTELDSANNNRRDNYRREFNDRDRGNNKRPFERSDDRGGNNRDRDKPWREREREREPPRGNAIRRNSRERERERERRTSPSRRVNPFRRNDEAPLAGIDKHSNKVRHDERQDFRHGESRADRNDQRSPKRSFQKKERDSDNENYEWGGRKAQKDNEKDKDEEEPAEKEKPNFGLSGKLTEDTNKVNGVVIKYAEPPEARRSKRLWRFYPFKGTESLQTIYLHRQSCYLIGRDKKICEMAVDHPSCSKQHAAFQYRLVPYEREDGTKGKHVLPYIIDLESANGTFVNSKKIEPKKYVELRERDVVKFGFSTREYVLLHKDSKMAPADDDVDLEEEEISIKSEPSD